jgi:PhzF family phenazine biosynthesis protein
LFFRLPQPLFATLEETQLAAAARALGISRAQIERGAIVDVGAVWLTLQLRDAEAVTNLQPEMNSVAALSVGRATGITVFGLQKSGSPTDIEVRSFAPADGVPEDPVCGSGNGCVAAIIARDHVLGKSSYVAGQGRRLNRDGRVEIRFEDSAIWVGGEAVTCVEGTLFPDSVD